MPVGPFLFCRVLGRFWLVFFVPRAFPTKKLAGLAKKCGGARLPVLSLLGATTKLAPFGVYWGALGHAKYPQRTGTCRGDINVREYVAGQGQLVSTITS